MSRFAAPAALALLVLPIVAAGPALLATPASAAEELGLSKDGVHWVSAITGPLFDGPARWVPGDSQTATFFVRNQSGDAGDLVVDVAGPKDSLLDSGALRVTARGAGGEWSTVSEPGRHRLLTAPDLAPGAVAPIDVTVSLDAAAGNGSQAGSTRLMFHVTLSESIPGGTPTGQPTSAPTGGSSPSSVPSPPRPRPDGVTAAPPPGPSLPRTGADAVSWVVGLAAVLIGAGLAFASRRPGHAATPTTAPEPAPGSAAHGIDHQEDAHD